MRLLNCNYNQNFTTDSELSALLPYMEGVKTEKLKNQKYLRYANTTNGITIYDFLFNKYTFNNNTLDGSRENNGPEFKYPSMRVDSP